MATTRLPARRFFRGEKGICWRYGSRQLTGYANYRTEMIEFYSYNTLVALYDELDGTLYVTADYFSVTTSAHVRGLEYEYGRGIKVPHARLREIAEARIVH